MKKIFNFQFIKFVIIGGINTLCGVLISYLLSLMCDANVAFVIGYILGLLISYVLNTRFTFNEEISFSKFYKFTVSYVPNFIIQNIIVFVIYNILNLYQLIAYLLAAIVGLPITFLLMKFYAFKEI